MLTLSVIKKEIVLDGLERSWLAQNTPKKPTKEAITNHAKEAHEKTND